MTTVDYVDDKDCERSPVGSLVKESRKSWDEIRKSDCVDSKRILSGSESKAANGRNVHREKLKEHVEKWCD